MNEDLTRRLILTALLGSFLLLAGAVLYRFMIPVAWAAILAFVTWPLHRRLCEALRGQRSLAALLMTVTLAALFVLPVMGVVSLLRAELPLLLKTVEARLSQGMPPLPAVLREIPYAGPWLDAWLRHMTQDPGAVRQQFETLMRNSSDEVLNFIGGVGRNVVKFAFALLTVFFFYRDGERVVEQLRQVLRRFLGPAVDGYLDAVGATTRAVVYGLVLTALAQGVLAGLGYWGAGIGTPVLLGAITVLIALIPFGTPLVWGGAGLWLLLSGQTWQGIGLLLWGALVVSWVDNLIRPLVISQATRIPFIIVMFGVLGGVAAFGLIGLFVGPVVLAVLMAVWREWLEEESASAPSQQPPQ